MRPQKLTLPLSSHVCSLFLITLTSNCRRTAVSVLVTTAPSSFHPADHSRRLLYPDVWQLHAAHILLRLLTCLHLGESSNSCVQSRRVQRDQCIQMVWNNRSCLSTWTEIQHCVCGDFDRLFYFVMCFFPGNHCFEGSVCSSLQTWHRHMGV